MNLKKSMLKSLKKKWKGEIAIAESTISIYLQNPAGIGDHPDIIGEIEKQVGKIAEAQDKIEALTHFERRIK